MTPGNIPFRRVSTADNNAVCLKAKATRLVALVVGNINAAVRYLKFYDKASTPAPGTDTPVFVVPIPGGGSAGAGGTIPLGEGIPFYNGLSMALVTGIADSDNTGVAANEIIVSGLYE